MAASYPAYVRTPTKCLINKLNTNISSRKLLTASLGNSYTKSLLFILMNPSQANEHESDKTINKCASIAYHDLSDLKVGRFSIVNVYPFYQSTSSKLQMTIRNVKKTSLAFYYRELFNNLRKVKQKIANSNYIIVATGEIPENILDQKEYQFILDTIVSIIETHKQTVYLTTSKSKYGGKYVYKKSYSYHICPQGNPHTIDALKRHKIVNGEFVEIPNEQGILLTPRI